MGRSWTMRARGVKIGATVGLLLLLAVISALLWHLPGQAGQPAPLVVATPEPVEERRAAQRALVEKVLAEEEAKEAALKAAGEIVGTVVSGHGCVGHYYEVTASLDEMALKSAVIARVRLRQVEAAGVRLAHDLTYHDDVGYNGSLRFTLDVLEYLKGTGGSQLTAYVYGREGCYEDYTADTVQEAEQLGEPLLGIRDRRFDDREAIVFLRRDESSGHLYLGFTPIHPGGGWSFGVQSAEFRAWLPANSTSTTATSTTNAARTLDADRSASPQKEPQRFLLDDPDNPSLLNIAGTTDTGNVAARQESGVRTRVAAQQSGVPSVTVEYIRSRVAAVEREYNGGDGSQAYRDCVEFKYEWHSRVQQEIQEYGSVRPFGTKRRMPSGLPAQTIAFTTDSVRWRTQDETELPPGDRIWTEGRDADMLVGVWPGVIKTTRPLPVGEYRALFGAMPARHAICDAQPRAQMEASQYFLTVEAPMGTLAESFFDPYADGSAVTGTTTVGTISWQAGRVTADLTIDVIGHALDFIGLDGTTTLSLIVADATESAGTLTWTVPTQPWSAGDKLMLRVRRHEAPTPTPTPTATPTPTPTATPTPIPTDRPVILFLDSLDASVLDSLEMAVGEVFWVSIQALNLARSASYTIELTRVNDEPAGGVGIVFHYQAYGYTPQSIRVSSGNTSYARTMAVKLCTGTGGTVTAVLKRGNATLATTDLEVSTPP